MMILKPIRTPWNAFPSVVIHSLETAVKQHPDYAAAKSGNAQAAFSLVSDTLSLRAVDTLKSLIGTRRPILVSAHAFEREGVNAIPEALADELGQQLGLEVDGGLVQINIVGHTGANGYAPWHGKQPLMELSSLVRIIFWSMTSSARAGRWRT